MQRTAETPSELLRYFTHPAGTSIRALQEMANHDVKGMLVKAASAAVVRSREIARFVLKALLVEGDQLPGQARRVAGGDVDRGLHVFHVLVQQQGARGDAGFV